MVSASKVPAPAGDPRVASGVLQCPVPISERTEITIGHGGGGRLTEELIEKVFRPAFSNPALDCRHDGALLQAGGARLAFTIDSHVVSPLFFPGGDIGKVAVNGTVNDLAMCGARPLWLSAGFILEEGLPIEVLCRVVASMRAAARAAGISIVTGDTKVVERGKGDGLYVTTAGVGLVEEGVNVGPARIAAGDVVILSGDIGRHGMAVMAVREGMTFESTIESDCAPLAAPVAALLAAKLEVHCLRDLTRGGLATALIELAETRGLEIAVDEGSVSVTEEVRGACEILGLEPLYVANEGRFVCFVPESDALAALAVLARSAPGGPPAVIGRVRASTSGEVMLRRLVGAERILSRLSGEQLPRIC
jgi:hydrogenase expression/formation protein HypE